MSTARLDQSYTVTFAGGSYTITYTSFPSETMVAVQTEFVLHVLDHFFYMRSATSNTLLDWRKCTSPVAANRAALITAIQNLYNPTVFTPTLTISPSTATDQLAVVNNSKVIFCNFPEPASALCRLTFPTASDTLVGRASAETLTNKTLTSPVMTGPRLTGVGTFSANPAEFVFNLFTSDGNAYFDHGTAARSVLFRSNNGGTTQMTISDAQTSVPRLQISAPAATNALVLGTTNQAQIQYATLGASRVLTIPDPGAAAQFVMTAGNQTIGGTKTFSTGILLPTTGGTAAAFNHYEETTHATTFTGGTFTSGSITLGIVRIGRLVFIRWPAIQGAATAALTNNTALPARFLPTAIQAFNCPGQVNGVVTPIQVSIGTTGILTFAQSNGTGFTTGTSGPSLGGITYYLI